MLSPRDHLICQSSQKVEKERALLNSLGHSTFFEVIHHSCQLIHFTDGQEVRTRVTSCQDISLAFHSHPKSPNHLSRPRLPPRTPQQYFSRSDSAPSSATHSRDLASALKQAANPPLKTPTVLLPTVIDRALSMVPRIRFKVLLGKVMPRRVQVPVINPAAGQRESLGSSDEIPSPCSSRIRFL
jgi:hypothetical protein